MKVLCKLVVVILCGVFEKLNGKLLLSGNLSAKSPFSNGILNFYALFLL